MPNCRRQINDGIKIAIRKSELLELATYIPSQDYDEAKVTTFRSERNMLKPRKKKRLSSKILAPLMIIGFGVSCGLETNLPHSSDKSIGTRDEFGQYHYMLTYTDTLSRHLGIDTQIINKKPLSKQFLGEAVNLVEEVTDFATLEFLDIKNKKKSEAKLMKYLSNFGQCYYPLTSNRFLDLKDPRDFKYALNIAKPLGQGQVTFKYKGRIIAPEMKNFYLPLNHMHQMMVENGLLNSLAHQKSSLASFILGAVVGAAALPVIYNMSTNEIQNAVAKGVMEGAGVVVDEEELTSLFKNTLKKEGLTLNSEKTLDRIYQEFTDFDLNNKNWPEGKKPEVLSEFAADFILQQKVEEKSISPQMKEAWMNALKEADKTRPKNKKFLKEDLPYLVKMIGTGMVDVKSDNIKGVDKLRKAVPFELGTKALNFFDNFWRGGSPTVANPGSISASVTDFCKQKQLFTVCAATLIGAGAVIGFGGSIFGIKISEKIEEKGKRQQASRIFAERFSRIESVLDTTFLPVKDYDKLRNTLNDRMVRMNSPKEILNSRKFTRVCPTIDQLKNIYFDENGKYRDIYSRNFQNAIN